MSSPLFLGHDDVLNNLPFEDLFKRLVKGFVDFTKNDFIQPARMILNVQDKNMFLVKPVISLPEDSIATKLLTIYPENEEKYNKPIRHAVVVLFDATTGSLQGVMDGTPITDRRTAVATAVGIKYLSKRHDGILAIIGTGHQGKSHVLALKALFNFKEIRVYSRSKERREKFAEEMDVVCSDSVEEAVKNADVIVTVTMSTTPVLFKKWVKVDALVNVVGAPFSHQREVDDDLILTSQIIADSAEESYKSAGDIVATKAKVDRELGSVIQGKSKVDWDRIRVFKSNGLAVQDLISAKIVVENVLNGRK